MRRFLIDTDTASDDAVALVIALRQPEVHVEAITVVAGNVTLDQAVQNALYTVELCGANVPVYAGAAAPLNRPLETAQHVHGEDGMGDIGLPLFGRAPAEGYGPQVIVDIVRSHKKGEVSLITLGPLTNVALALQLDPAISKQLYECVVMGGNGIGPISKTQPAEYNLWVDPEAAEIVFRSGMSIRLVGWDISARFATLNSAEAARLREVGTDLARFCVEIQATLTDFARKESGLEGFDLPDPITVAIAIEPEIATSDLVSIRAVGKTDSDRGLLHFERGCDIEVVEAADKDRFLQRLIEAVS